MSTESKKYNVKIVYQRVNYDGYLHKDGYIETKNGNYTSLKTLCDAISGSNDSYTWAIHGRILLYYNDTHHVDYTYLRKNLKIDFGDLKEIYVVLSLFGDIKPNYPNITKISTIEEELSKIDENYTIHDALTKIQYGEYISYTDGYKILLESIYSDAITDNTCDISDIISDLLDIIDKLEKIKKLQQ